MRAYYFRAYDAHGHKRVGKMMASSAHLVRAQLLRNGLRPYIIKDLQALKVALQVRRIRRRHLLTVFAATAVSALVLGWMIVAYAGHAHPLDVASYAQSGILKGAPNVVTADNEEARQFGVGIYDIWNAYCPGVATGIEVRSPVMVVYVSDVVRRVSDTDLKALATNSAKALQRKLAPSGCTVLVSDGTVTVFEVTYNGYTHNARVQSYR